MRLRYYLLLCCLLPVCAFAQRKLSFGLVVAAGTSGIQEPLRVSEAEPLVFGNRLSGSYQFGLALRRSLGEQSALLGELTWVNTRTRFVNQFLTGNNQRPEVEQSRFRINGGQFALLFQRSLDSDRNFTPLLEAGLGLFLLDRVRADFSVFDWQRWETVETVSLQTFHWRPIVGIGVQHRDRLSLSLRFSVATENLFEDRGLIRCIQFCTQGEGISRPGTGLNTQQLQLTYLW